MKLFNKKQVITLAFNTEDDNNRLSQERQFALIEKLSRAFGGATLRENVGGYMMDDGTAAIEYSYTIELFDVSCDYLTASIEDDGLNIVYIDHDGVNTTTMKFVTEAMIESYYTAGKWYDLNEFAEERLVPTAKPTQAYWFKKFA